MKKTLQIKNYPEKEIDRLKVASVRLKKDYVDIVVPAVIEYLKENKKK